MSHKSLQLRIHFKKVATRERLPLAVANGIWVKEDRIALLPDLAYLRMGAKSQPMPGHSHERKQ